MNVALVYNIDSKIIPVWRTGAEANNSLYFQQMLKNSFSSMFWDALGLML